MKNNTLLILALLLSLNALGQKIDKFPGSLYKGKYSNKDFFNKAEYIFEGDVISNKKYLNEDSTGVFSSTLIKIIHTYKGEINADTVEFIRDGGKYKIEYDDLSIAILDDNSSNYLTMMSRKMIFFAKKRKGRTFNYKFKIKLEPWLNKSYASIFYSNDPDCNFKLFGLKDLYFKNMAEFQRYAKKLMRWKNKDKFKEKKIVPKVENKP